MAIIVKQIPAIIAPNSNYMWCIIQGDPSYVGYSNYYIQFHIKDYLNSTTLIRNNVKVHPDVYNGFAVYDIHSLMQNYCSIDTTPTSYFLGLYNSEYSFLQYKIDAIEMTGSTVLSTAVNAITGFTFNGAIERGVTWDYTDYIFAGNEKFLSNWKGDRVVRHNDIASLSFFDRIGNANVKAIYIDVYASNGSIVHYSYINSEIYNYGLINFSTGPCQIEGMTWQTGYTIVATTSATGILSGNGATSYVIKAADKYGNSCSEEIMYVIDEYCSLIEDVELMWLNKLSGWDNFTFYRERHKGIRDLRTSYTKIDYEMVAEVMINPVGNRGETILDIDGTTVYTVRSKILSNTMFENVCGLFDSPEVFVRIGGGEAIPIIIETEEYEIFNNYNRGTRPYLEFSFRFANKNNNLNG